MTNNIHHLFSWVDVSENAINPMQRLYAYLIDWFIGGIVTGLPAVVTYALVTNRTDIFTDLYMFPTLGYSVFWSYFCFAMCLIAFIFYFVIVPWKIYPGQTLGKKWLHMHIATSDGSRLGFRTLCIREFFGMVVVEGVSCVLCQYFRQTVTLASGFYTEGWMIMIGYILTIFSGILATWTPSHRSLHDYIAHTRVVPDK